MTQQGHIAITVSGVKTPLVIDPRSYSVVDIVDFAPRAISGTPAFSEQGLYLDVGQDDFGHGYGFYTFSDPAGYQYSGHQVDTRHGFINLFTSSSAEVASAPGKRPTRLIVQNGITLVAYQDGDIAVKKPSDGSFSDLGTFSRVQDILSTGTYFLVARWYTTDVQMQLAYVGQVDSSTSTTITIASEDWDVDIFNGGTVKVFDGTGSGNSASVTDTTTDTITFDSSITTDSTSYFVVLVATGSGANPPDNFGKLARFGGFYWATEKETNYVHFWAEDTGASAEGGGDSDAAAVKVGPDGGKLVNLMAFDNQLWAFREDGAWTIAEDNLAYHTLDLASEISSSNFKSVIVWNGFMVFPIRNRLYKYRSGLQDITPPVFNQYPPYKMFGDWDGLVARGKFLYLTGRSNEAFSDESAEGTAGFGALFATDGVGWHKLMTFPQVNGTDPDEVRAYLDPVNDILYISGYDKDNNEGRLDSIQLQTLSDLPYATFPTSGNHHLYTSYYDLGMRRIPKSWASLTIGGDFPDGTSVAWDYRTDDTQSWTASATDFTSDQQEIDLPVGVTGKKIQFRLNLKTTDGTETPFVRYIVIKCMMRPDVLYGVTCDVIVSSNIHDQHMGANQGLTSAKIKSALESARASVPPITFTDLHGTDQTAYLASLRFININYEDENYVEQVARCTFVYV